MTATLSQVSFEAEKAELVRLLIDTGAFQFSDVPKFKLVSGQLSSFYIDNKKAFSHAKFRKLVGRWVYRLVAEKVARREIEAVGGLILGACPIAQATSDAADNDGRELLYFTIRKKEKEHGLGNLVEGAVHPGNKVLIVDDVVTSGGSTIEAIDKARGHNLEVVEAIAIVDRQEQDGANNIRARGVPFRGLCTRDDLILAWKSR